MDINPSEITKILQIASNGPIKAFDLSTINS